VTSKERLEFGARRIAANVAKLPDLLRVYGASTVSRADKKIGGFAVCRAVPCVHQA